MKVLFQSITHLFPPKFESTNWTGYWREGILNGQKNIETKITGIQKRLFELEDKSQNFDHLGKELHNVFGTLADCSNSFQTRRDEFENRLRLDSLIFHGLSDAKETWSETERLSTGAIKEVFQSFSTDSIDRAHSLGPFSPTKCHPIIVKFASFKAKQKNYFTSQPVETTFQWARTFPPAPVSLEIN